MLALLLFLFTRTITAGCDVLMFLLLVRLICRWRSVGLLWEFDVAGAPLLDRVFRGLRREWSRLSKGRPGPIHEIGLAIMLTLLVRLPLSGSIVVR